MADYSEVGTVSDFQPPQSSYTNPSFQTFEQMNLTSQFRHSKTRHSTNFTISVRASPERPLVLKFRAALQHVGVTSNTTTKQNTSIIVLAIFDQKLELQVRILTAINYPSRYIITTVRGTRPACKRMSNPEKLVRSFQAEEVPEGSYFGRDYEAGYERGPPRMSKAAKQIFPAGKFDEISTGTGPSNISCCGIIINC